MSLWITTWSTRSFPHRNRRPLQSFIRSRDEENPSGSKPRPTFDPSGLIGKNIFYFYLRRNGERHRSKGTRQVVEIIDQGQWPKNRKILNFILDIGNGKVEETNFHTNQLLEHLEKCPRDHGMGHGSGNFISFRAIIGTPRVLCLPQIQTGKEANINVSS